MVSRASRQAEEHEKSYTRYHGTSFGAHRRHCCWKKIVECRFQSDHRGRKVCMISTLKKKRDAYLLTQHSDTTASALTMLFVLLAIHPTYQQKLRREVEVSFQDGTYNSAKPQDLLDGIINEALRLFPPATFASQRVTPAEGLTIGNVHIPPDTVISIGTYQIHHGTLFFPVSRHSILTS
jgi:hypothetical protein